MTRQARVPACVSTSRIAYGSIRAEPIFMILGHSAAAAAVQAVAGRVDVQAIDHGWLRARLLDDKQVLDWAVLGR